MALTIAALADAPAELRDRLEALGEVRVLSGRMESEEARGALQAADCVVLAATQRDVLSAARRIHEVDGTLQLVLVVAAERRAEVEHALLFAPGLGEVWLIEPDELRGGVLGRAATVTRQRRRYRTTRRRLEEELSAVEPQRRRRALISDAYLAALLQVLPDPVLSLDDQGRILSWTPAAERLLGYNGAEATGRPVVELLAPEDAGALEEALEEAHRGVRHVEVRYRTRRGDTGVAEVAITPVEAAGHRVRAVLLHDVTEQRRARSALEEQTVELEAQAHQLQEQASELEMLNTELQERTLELEEAIAARSRFYAAMSHELRTPMNAIIGYNALLLDELFGPLPPQQADAVRRAQRAAQHLLELVNDVLDLAKIEAGRIELQPEETEFPRLLAELLDTVRPMAEEHDTPLTLRTTAGPPHRIQTDPRRVRQVLLNLLSNAIKFGEGKPVQLAWEVTPDQGVGIEVSDRGRGISEEDVARIFEEFVQIGSSDGSGTGLGLPISRRLALALGGDLEVRSTPGAGSTFRLRLPPTLPR